MHVQSCCFAHKPIAFGPFRCRLRRGCYDVGDSADDYGHDISHSKDKDYEARPYFLFI